MAMTHDYSYITGAAELARAVEHLSRADVIGVDTEADSFYSYTEKVCLIQVTGAGRDFIIDPLAIQDLSPLAPLMADRAVTKVFHGADYDVVSLKRDFRFEIRNLFDTMIAAQAVGVERFSLADLVEREFGRVLEKKYQRHDWSSRPLEPQHLDYARLDSHYLPELRDRLWAEVVEKGRQEQVLEEFALLEEREWTGRAMEPDDWLRVKGSNRLKPEQQKVARELYRLRDRLARELDRPPFKVMGNDALLEISRVRPRSREALRGLLGERHFLFRRYAADVVQAVQKGFESEESLTVPRSSRGDGSRRPFSREDDRLFESLKAWRNKAAEGRGVGPAVVVSNVVLKAIAIARPRDEQALSQIPEIRRWQVQEFGDELLRLVAADVLQPAKK